MVAYRTWFGLQVSVTTFVPEVSCFDAETHAVKLNETVLARPAATPAVFLPVCPTALSYDHLVAATIPYKQLLKRD